MDFPIPKSLRRVLLHFYLSHYYRFRTTLLYLYQYLSSQQSKHVSTLF